MYVEQDGHCDFCIHEPILTTLYTYPYESACPLKMISTAASTFPPVILSALMFLAASHNPYLSAFFILNEG